MTIDGLLLGAFIGFLLGWLSAVLHAVRHYDRKVDRDIEARKAWLDEERGRRIFEKHGVGASRGKIDRAARDPEWGMARPVVDTTIRDL